MRIVMLSDLESSGGAAIAAGRLAEALVVLGTEVIRVVGQPDGRTPAAERHGEDFRSSENAGGASGHF